MSNNNEHWGRRFGFFDKHIPRTHDRPFGNCFKRKQMTSGRTNTGPHQIGYDPRSLVGMMAEKQRQEFQRIGRPTVYYNSNNRRIS